MSDRPYYIDDPLVDRAAHKLEIRTDLQATTEAGWPRVFGYCSCGEWTTPSWDSDAVLGEFDQHMAAVQETAHQAARRGHP